MRLILICKDVMTPYSGMLPGHRAGMSKGLVRGIDRYPDTGWKPVPLCHHVQFLHDHAKLGVFLYLRAETCVRTRGGPVAQASSLWSLQDLVRFESAWTSPVHP